MNNPEAVIAFVGTRHGKETELVPRAGYPLYYIKIQGVRRSLSPSNLLTAWYILTSPHEAKKLICSFSPDIVIGTGGYACWPTLKAAAELGIPTMVHESNAMPGLAVRVLRKKVDRILINFVQTRDLLKLTGAEKAKKVVRVGNPTRQGFGAGIPPEEAKRRLNIENYNCFVMSFGGSLGAEVINECALSLMEEIARRHPDLYYMHAAGERYYDKMKEELKKKGLDRAPNILLCDYIHDMPRRMAAADIVISRAGAMTISELASAGCAAILIPSPNVVDNHQFKNAKVLADAGAAVLLEESEIRDSGRLTDTVLRLAGDTPARKRLGQNIREFADKDANRLIYEEIQKLLAEKAKK
ncbi:MAG: UDP-N-acetylglucosamine--N-acetylmuramyl-(pentapeptide) pyrophosphoryl-undecaprenol N-acetylglucosamine transferase [Clostridiales bacterium]|nr:UDP-N-acetylglucosamine--N-acetylmuramyl-(pentapeptide) pyrophosphoryl-undecaprenol N-acetylglucosamine transferase [Clostridiales bacterium]